MQLQTPAQPLTRALLEAPGGFVWWYLDAVDISGDGIVLIWSFGLPFLPGYLDAARKGQAPNAGTRPSLNLVTYRGGKPDAYLLQEYDPLRSRWTQSPDGDAWQFGDCRLSIRPQGSEVELEAELSCPVPGSRHRLTGRIRARGCATRLATTGPDQSSSHGWNPISGPAKTHVRLQFDDRTLMDFDGIGYLDRNGSSVPFSELGIDHWIWGRWVDAACTRIFFVLFPEGEAPPQAWLVDVDADGSIRGRWDATCKLRQSRRALYGMPYWTELQLQSQDHQVTVTTQRLVEDGPFYLRSLGTMDVDGATGPVVTEWIRPDRVDQGHHRPLVRMRVHRPDAPNSWWVPLFMGPRDGRIRRLLSSWVGQDRRALATKEQS